MKLGLVGESAGGETRVALVPSMVCDLVKLGAEVFVERNAGLKSSFTDKDYESAGAKVVDDVFSQSNILLMIQPPTRETLGKIKDGSTIVGLFWVLTDKALVSDLMKKRLTVFSLELVPRITRAQSMDVLSSMATVSGYKAVLLATERFGKFFPMLMTAAGTIPPANVLVIGAGVAGLSAIATAKRLGAKVEAFDTRPAVKEQIESLGARFIEMQMPQDSETKGGYAREASDEFIFREREAISSRLPKTDILITTAQVFGKKAPLIVTDKMIQLMPHGSVIVDIAAEQGGNTELTKAGEVIVKHDVTIMGPTNLPSQLPVHASMMYSKNVVSLLKLIFGGKDKMTDFTDEVVLGCCVLRDGVLVSEAVKTAFGGLTK